jgi:hypothetical protein
VDGVVVRSLWLVLAGEAAESGIWYAPLLCRLFGISELVKQIPENPRANPRKMRFRVFGSGNGGDGGQKIESQFQYALTGRANRKTICGLYSE